MRLAVLVFATLLQVTAATAQIAPAAPVVAHPGWAQPIALAGVPKLHRVTEGFYRSAQPTADGFAALTRELGVRAVISLRAYHSDRGFTEPLDLRYMRFPMHTWNIRRKHVVGALRSLRLAIKRGPVLLHCEHGADRTGLITALYRVVYQGWSKEAAIEEMRNGDFGFHAVWGNIPSYIRGVEVDALRREIGVL